MAKFRLIVKKGDNTEEPYMRGILTHSLIKRGLNFEKAYGIAQLVKSNLSKKQTITLPELQRVIDTTIIKKYGKTTYDRLHKTSSGFKSPILVTSKQSQSNYSKGLLAKTVTSAGIPPNRAYDYAQDLQNDLYNEDIHEITKIDIKKRMSTKNRCERGP